MKDTTDNKVMAKPLKPYKTILYPFEDSFIERKSEFIARAFPASSEEEALSLIAKTKSQQRKATHNCYAYIIRGEPAKIERYNDDGEPSGTAGMPILEVMRSNDIVDTVVIVTRYFGGILLGAGGLVRAYSKAAALCIKGADVVTMRAAQLVEIEIEYSKYEQIKREIPSFGGFIKTEDFSDNVRLEIVFPFEAVLEFKKRLVDILCGNVCINELSTFHHGFKDIHKSRGN